MSHIEVIELTRRLNKDLHEACINESMDAIKKVRPPNEATKVYIDNLKMLLEKAKAMLP